MKKSLQRHLYRSHYLRPCSFRGSFGIYFVVTTMLSLAVRSDASNASWQGEVEYTGVDAVNTTRLLEEGILASVSARRQVNFNGLNQVLAPVVVVLPKLEGIGTSDIQMDVTQLECRRLSIGSIDVGTLRQSSRLLNFNASFQNISGVCQAQFSFVIWGFLKGDGQVSVEFENADGPSSVKVRTLMESAYEYGPPTFASTPYCKPQWRLKLSLWGTPMADFLNAFSDLLRDAIQDQFNAVVCEEIEKVAPSWLTDAWLNLTDELGPYIPCSEDKEQIIVHKGASYTQCIPADKFATPDPSSIEKDLVPMLAGSDVLDLQESFIFGLLQPLQNRLGGLLNETLPDGSLQTDLGINVGIRKLLAGKNALSLSGRFSLWESDDNLFAIKAAVTNITIEGLDSFANFSLMLPFSPWSWGLDFNLRRLKMSVAVQVEMQPSKILLQGGGLSNVEVSNLAINNTFTTTVELNGLAFHAIQLLAIDATWLKQLRLGQLFVTPLGCALKAALVANVTKLEVALKDLVQPSMAGVVGIGVDTLVNALIEALFKMLRLPTLNMLPNIVRNKARSALNDWVNLSASVRSAECAAPMPMATAPNYLNFRSSNIVSTVTSAVNAFLDPSEAQISSLMGNVTRAMNSSAIPPEIRQVLQLSRNLLSRMDRDATALGTDVLNDVGIDSNIVGIDKVNQLVGEATKPLNAEGVMGTIELSQVYSFEKDLGSFGRFSLSFSDLKASGLDTYSEVILGKSTSDFSTKHFFSFGNVTRNPKVEVTVALNVEGGTLGEIKDAVTLSLAVSSLNFFADILTKLDQARLKSLTMEQLFTPDCVLATFREGGLGINNFSLALNGIRLDLNCASCTTPYLRQLSEEWNKQDATDFELWLDDPNEFLANLSGHLQSPQFQKAIDTRIRESTRICGEKTQALEWADSLAHPESVQVELGSRPGLKLTMSIGFFVGFAFVFLAVCGCFKYVCRGCWPQKEDDQPDTPASHALVNSSGVPLCFRIAVVLLLLVCLGLFCLGHALLVMQFDVRLRLLGKIIAFDGFKVNIINGIMGLYESGAYLFFAVITSTCFLWPYIRTLALLALWCIPPRGLKPQNRGKAFRQLDLMQKWSQFGVLAMVMFVVFIATSLSIELIFSPLVGLCCNFTGQAICQAVSRVIAHYHKKVMGLSLPVADPGSERPKVLPRLLGRPKTPTIPTTSEAGKKIAGQESSEWLPCPETSVPVSDCNADTTLASARSPVDELRSGPAPVADIRHIISNARSSTVAESPSHFQTPSRGRFRFLRGRSNSSQSVGSGSCAAIAESDVETGEPAGFNLPSTDVPQIANQLRYLRTTQGVSSSPLYTPSAGTSQSVDPRLANSPLTPVTNSPLVRIVNTPLPQTDDGAASFHLPRLQSASHMIVTPWYSCACAESGASASRTPMEVSSTGFNWANLWASVATPPSVRQSQAGTPPSVHLAESSRTGATAATPSFIPGEGTGTSSLALPGLEPLQSAHLARLDATGSITPSDVSFTCRSTKLMLPGTWPTQRFGSPQESRTTNVIANTPRASPMASCTTPCYRQRTGLSLASVELSTYPEQLHGASVGSFMRLKLRFKFGVLMVNLISFIVPASLTIGGLLPILGALLPATSVTTSGVVAVVVKFGGPDVRTSEFSVLQLILNAPERLNVWPIGTYGVWTLTIALALGILVVPFLQAIVWVIIWVVPLSRKNLQRLLRWSSVLSGMSFFEIFLISFLMTLLQLDGLAFGLLSTLQEGVGDRNFLKLQSTVAALNDIGVVGAEDAKIFGLTADLGSGVYVLLLAAFLLRFGGFYVESKALKFLKITESPTCDA